MPLFGPPNMEKLAEKRDVNGLVKALGQNDPQLRRKAVAALGQVGDARAVEPLIALLTDGDRDITVLAIEALGRVGDSRCIAPLTAASEGEGMAGWPGASTARAAVADRLAVDDLIAFLAHEDAKVRRYVAWTLGARRDGREVEPLIVLLADDDAEVQKVAAHALGEVGDPRAVAPLISALEVKVGVFADGIWEYRTEDLERLGNRLPMDVVVALLADNDVRVRRYAARTLEWQQMDDGEREHVRRTGDRTFAAWSREPREETRAAVEPLIAALQDESAEVRLAAAFALGALGGRLAVEPSIAALKDEDRRVKRAAIRVLGARGDARAFEPLMSLVMNDGEVAGEAIDALGRLGDARAVEPLIAVLQSSTTKYRAQATWALSRLGDRRAVEPLANLLSESGPGVVGSVRAQFGDRRALKSVVAGGDREQIVTDFEQIVVEALMLVLRDEDPVSRADTAMALAYAGGPSAAEPLAALLGDEDERVRMCAAWALAELGDPHAVDGLVSAFLESPSDKIYLAGGCAERLIQAGTDGVEALVEAAKSVEAGERGLRKIAIECLESAGHREEATRLRDHTEFEKHSRQRTERAEGLQEWAREAVTSPAEAARVLVGLYDRTPGGFVKSDSGADYVRAVGRRLDEIGGFEGMLEAHALFAAARPGMARNLEMVWDGVGTWAG